MNTSTENTIINIPEIKLQYTSGIKKKLKVGDISDAVQLLRKIISPLEIELREEVVVLYLNRSNTLKGYYRHSTGGIMSSTIDNRLILATALKSLSTNIILCHNHPSGNCKPSMEDIRVTTKLKSAAKQMDITLLDHIILTKNDYYSFFAEQDSLKKKSGIDGIPYQQMKTPITYYGGKQTLLKYILPLIPEHKLYCEPFFGGGAVFFAKTPAETEVINDVNSEVINFFRVVKTNFPALQKEIQATLHSRELYKNAMVVYEHPDLFDEVKRAWAFWTLTNQGFAGLIGSWGFGKDHSKEKAIANKRDDFDKSYAGRFRTVQIEHNDALKVIERCDSKDSFIYADPPYIGSDMGHYKGYSEEEYERLLQALGNLKGKFLLSSYPSKILNRYIKKYKWKVKKIEKVVAVTKHTDKKKTEMLVMNYDPSKINPPDSVALKHLSVKQIAEQLKHLNF